MMRLDIFKILWYASPEDIVLGIRRELYCRFRKKYVKESISRRKGHCNWKKCGHICCYTLFCKNFNVSTHECKINEKKPLSCGLSPIDNKDQPRRTKLVCTYYWDDEE